MDKRAKPIHVEDEVVITARPTMREIILQGCCFFIFGFKQHLLTLHSSGQPGTQSNSPASAFRVWDYSHKPLCLDYKE